MTDPSEFDDTVILNQLTSNDINDIKYIHKLVNNSTLRDYDTLYTNPQFYTALIQTYTHYTLQYDQSIDTSKNNVDSHGAISALQTVYSILCTIIGYTEFDTNTAKRAFNKQFVERLVNRLNSKHSAKHNTGLSSVPQAILHSVGVFNTASSDNDISNKQEFPLIRTLLHSLYHKCVYLRSSTRQQLSLYMSRYIRSPHNNSGIGDVIAIWSAIISGCIVPLKQQYVDVLNKYIVQLHTLDHTLLSTFHDRLTYCIIQYIKKDKTLSVPIINKLINFNTLQQSNKHVLIIHEIESILELMSNDLFQSILQPFIQFLIYSLENIQFQIAERAAQLFQNAAFVALIQQNSQFFVDRLLPILTTKHWNKTVERMYENILYILYTANKEYYVTVLNKQLQHTSIAQTQQYCTQLFTKHESDALNKSKPDKGIHIPQKLQNIKYSNFVFGETLGAGSFSTVCVAKYVTKGKSISDWIEYAVKIVNKQNLQTHTQFVHNFNNEIECLNQLQHPNITQLIGLCENPVNYYMILEYANLGDLHTLISTNGSIDLKSTIFIAAEILNALQYIHTQGYIYSDLKPENVVIHENGHIKLIDFGSTRKFSTVSINDKIEGTVEYLAPELVKHTHTISTASDLWSFGCVLYQMLSGRPFVFADTEEYVDTHAAEHIALQKQCDSMMFDDDDSVDLGIDVKDVQQQTEHTNNSTTNNKHHTEHKSDHEQQEHDRQHILQKLQQFQHATDDMFPDSFPAVAKPLLMKLLVADPTQRLTDYHTIKSDTLFQGVDFTTLHEQTAPTIATGTVKATQIDSKWSRRKNSIMWAPNLPKYEFKDSAWILEPLIESTDDNDTVSIGTGISGVGQSSRRHVTTRASDLPDTPMSGITENDDEKSDSDDDSDIQAGNILLQKLGRQPLNTVHKPTVLPNRGALPPLPSKPMVGSSRKLGSTTSSKLLQSILNKKHVTIDESSNNK